MKNFISLSLVLLIISCGDVQNQHRLPIFGHHDYSETDTVYYTVGDFSLLNQDSVLMNNRSMDG